MNNFFIYFTLLYFTLQKFIYFTLLYLIMSSKDFIIEKLSEKPAVLTYLDIAKLTLEKFPDMGSCSKQYVSQIAKENNLQRRAKKKKIHLLPEGRTVVEFINNEDNIIVDENFKKINTFSSLKLNLIKVMYSVYNGSTINRSKNEMIDSIIEHLENEKI